MNPTSYERFEIWSKYFHIRGNFSYKNRINHEGEEIMNSILVPSNSRPAKYLKSTRFKKFAPNALWFTYQNLKSYKPHEKTNQNTSKCKLY